MEPQPTGASFLGRRKKRSMNSELAVDALLAKALVDDKSETSQPQNKFEDDTDTLFCKSLVSSFKELSPRSKK